MDCSKADQILGHHVPVYMKKAGPGKWASPLHWAEFHPFIWQTAGLQTSC